MSQSTVSTHRQRALLALDGKQPDFVPTFELVFHSVWRARRDYD